MQFRFPLIRLLASCSTILIMSAASLTPSANAFAQEPAAAPAPPAALPKPARGASTPVGSMEWLRQRLGDKLGATKDPQSEQALRIVNRSAKRPAERASDAAPTSALTSNRATVPGVDRTSDRTSDRTPDLSAGGAAIVARKTATLLPDAQPGSSARANRLAAAAEALPPEPPVAPASARAQWDYHGANAPHRWARLDPSFSACGIGKRQSPIDIRDSIKVNLDPVFFDYKPSAFSVIDDGHTIQVNLAAGNSIGILGRVYELVEFHFHQPAEEVVNGRRYDMVVHMLHRDAEGRLAMVAVLLERGNAQPVVQSVWNNLPLERHEAAAAQVPLDPADLLPSDRGYFTYIGSLTQPPCTEGVLWIVLRQPVQVSEEQLDIFSRLYPMNARPLQPSGGRLVKQSN